MNAADLIASENVTVGLRAASKEEVLRELARRAAHQVGISEPVILRALLDREALGSTGVGVGVALPHACIAGLGRLFGYFARLSSPIDYAAVDDQPVDLVFLMLGPEAPGVEYRKALASVSRVLRESGTRARLRAAAGTDEVCRIFAERGAGKTE
jgi:PTS system nitrogen regulatory IIA component